MHRVQRWPGSSGHAMNSSDGCCCYSCGCSCLSPTNFPSLSVIPRRGGAGLRLGTLVPLTIWWSAAAGIGWRGEGSKGGLLLLTKLGLTGHQICQCFDLRILRPHTAC